MTKLIGPDFIALQVRDLERSKRFYTEQMGLQPVPQSPPDAVVFATQPIPFAVRKPTLDLEAVSQLGWGVALWMQAENPDALCAQLETSGVPIVQKPFDGPFGRTFACLDPDGYRITVHGQ